MITCLDLVVGCVQTPYKEDTLRQCYDFLRQHKNLCKRKEIGFYIDNMLYCTLIDFVDDEYGFTCAFRIYDGSVNFIGIFNQKGYNDDKRDNIRIF